jgi:signal transduction histidine kinase
VQDEEGDISEYVGAAIDITQSMEAKSKIDAYRQELSKTRRLTELGMMSKVLAEKLKKPLNVAHVLLQRLAVEYDTAHPNQGMDNAVEQSLEQVNEAFSVVKRFCDHVDMPAAPPQNTALDLQDFFARLIAVFEDRAKRANLTITLAPCPPKICLIITSKELQYIVSTVIEHILERANTKTNQTLEIQCHFETDKLLIQFTDTCRGLSKEDIDNAFVPFALNTSDAEHHELGLAVVQQIAHENQGSITINSQEGQGTTFSLTLPTCPN